MATGLDRLVPDKASTLEEDRPKNRGPNLLHEACVEAMTDSEFPVWSVKAKALLLYLIKTNQDEGSRDWARISSGEVEEALRMKYPELYRAIAEELDSRTINTVGIEKET